MATVTITATSNADGTMTIKSTDVGGLYIVITTPNDERTHTWPKHLQDFIRGTLYP